MAVHLNLTSDLSLFLYKSILMYKHLLQDAYKSRCTIINSFFFSSTDQRPTGTKRSGIPHTVFTYLFYWMKITEMYWFGDYKHDTHSIMWRPSLDHCHVSMHISRRLLLIRLCYFLESLYLESWSKLEIILDVCYHCFLNKRNRSTRELAAIRRNPNRRNIGEICCWVSACFAWCNCPLSSRWKGKDPSICLCYK